MDQGGDRGVGNLLADEILWRARLSPRRPAGELSVDELDAPPPHDPRRRPGRDPRRRRPHGQFNAARVRGGVCPRCGTPLARDTHRRPHHVLVPRMTSRT